MKVQSEICHRCIIWIKYILYYGCESKRKRNKRNLEKIIVQGLSKYVGSLSFIRYRSHVGGIKSWNQYFVFNICNLF